MKEEMSAKSDSNSYLAYSKTDAPRSVTLWSRDAQWYCWLVRQSSNGSTTGTIFSLKFVQQPICSKKEDVRQLRFFCTYNILHANFFLKIIAFNLDSKFRKFKVIYLFGPWLLTKSWNNRWNKFFTF